ncbi:MAG: molybdopterin-dependent oxidoreductase [Wenzhouxiangellaceae bacterium]
MKHSRDGEQRLPRADSEQQHQTADVVADPGRRRLLSQTGLMLGGGVIGLSIPFQHCLPAGVMPLAYGANPLADSIPGKRNLALLSDRPVCGEPLPHELDDDITPSARHFIRNNGHPPSDIDLSAWRLQIVGEVERELNLSIAALQRDFEVVSANLVLECAGNGRAGFIPRTLGTQWTYGAVGCSRWTGVRLADVLRAAGVKSSAVYTAHYGADRHLSGRADKLPISRGVPIAKAMQPENLIAFAMNDQPLHPMNGAPLRLVIPGWPASCSHKWLNRIQLRDQVHDGPKMTGMSYRVPERPMAPGDDAAQVEFKIIGRMPVKSMITWPASNTVLVDAVCEVRGHAWAGERVVERVEVSIDFGATWQTAALEPPPNPGAWQRFRANVRFPQSGYYEVWARAIDEAGVSQPFVAAWNPKGYLNNAVHRLPLRVMV